MTNQIELRIEDKYNLEELNKEDHGKQPHEPPPGTPVYRCLDWGYAKPFSIGWYYLDNDKNLIRFKEWYGYGGEPDKGLRMESRDVAKKVLEIDERYNVAYGVADPSIWSKEDGPSIAENMRDEGVDWNPAISATNGATCFRCCSGVSGACQENAPRGSNMLA